MVPMKLVQWPLALAYEIFWNRTLSLLHQKEANWDSDTTHPPHISLPPQVVRLIFLFWLLFISSARTIWPFASSLETEGSLLQPSYIAPLDLWGESWAWVWGEALSTHQQEGLEADVRCCAAVSVSMAIWTLMYWQWILFTLSSSFPNSVIFHYFLPELQPFSVFLLDECNFVVETLNFVFF